MSGLAAFVESQVSTFYAQVCERWGVDPGAYLEAEDDVLAFNLRAALAMKTLPEPDADTEGGVVTDLARQMRALG